jgi:hypothetical protein
MNFVKKAFGREFKEGRVVINPKVGILSYVTETSPKGKSFFQAKVLQGNPLRVSENARESQLNKMYFRRATKKEMAEIQNRFRF